MINWYDLKDVPIEFVPLAYKGEYVNLWALQITYPNGGIGAGDYELWETKKWYALVSPSTVYIYDTATDAWVSAGFEKRQGFPYRQWRILSQWVYHVEEILEDETDVPAHNSAGSIDATGTGECTVTMSWSISLTNNAYTSITRKRILVQKTVYHCYINDGTLYKVLPENVTVRKTWKSLNDSRTN